MPTPLSDKKEDKRSGRAASLVAIGILVSRLTGLVRSQAFAHYFGSLPAADAVGAAFRIPNLLQNLFGEGAMSASFIPVYAGLLAKGESKEADRVAGAIAALLALVVSVLVLAGVLATPWLIDLIAPGFQGERRALTITLVRIFFPGAGFLALSAWCLGVLNSHHKFLLSYASPALYNLCVVATLIAAGGHTPVEHLAVIFAWGSVAASALQFGVQLPTVLRVAPQLRIVLDTASSDVRVVVKNFGPTFVTRGIVQLSAYIDQWLASWLPIGAVALLTYSQILYTLPVSLFGMAVSAAELPAMSREAGGEALKARLDAGLARIAYFVVPSAVAFLVLGDVLAGIFRSGRFTAEDGLWVWRILGGSAVGLLASTLGRLYSSAYYALRDTRTPLNYAMARVALTTVLGLVFAFGVPRWFGLDPRWGMAGLTASAGVAGWVEFVLLRRGITPRIGKTGVRAGYVALLWLAALVAAAATYGLKIVIPPMNAFLRAAVLAPVFGGIYLGLTHLTPRIFRGYGRSGSGQSRPPS
jgi:putative peptidoglycan lipid II flippase